MQQYGHFIDGTMSLPSSNTWFDSLDPYTMQPWAQIARGNALDVDIAVKSAHRAFKSEAWAGISASQRGKLLQKFALAVSANAEFLADIEARDNGKLISEIQVQCRLLSEWISYYAGLADKIEGRIPPIEKNQQIGLVRYEPFGVCAGITPWNSPLLLLIWKLAPALAAGNTFVAKPSEFTSVSTLHLAKIACEAGLPPGVFNVVTGFGQEIGAPLVDHPLVRRVAFTGGEQSGIAVAQAAARKLIPCTLELGGKSANIIFEDADVDLAVAGLISGVFAACGQTCMAGSRALLHEKIHDEVVEKLVKIVEKAKVGDPRNPDTNMGPVATEPQYQRIAELVNSAIEQGATLRHGGLAPEGFGGTSARFVLPTIFTGTRPNMRIVQEEVFGPVLAVMKFQDEEEAIQLANATEYGLAAGVWTRDLYRGMRVSQQLEAGTVWINTYRSTSYVMPFGGYKRSGIGRENGIEAIKEYLQQKSVHINLSNAPVQNPFIRR